MTTARLIPIAAAVAAAALVPVSVRSAPDVATRSFVLRQTQTLGDEPTVAPAYGWPLEPFGRQHPVRAFLDDPRIGHEGGRAFHFGIDIAAPDGTPLVLGGQKQRAVLALLLLRANRVVSTDFLVDALWGDNPPRTATTSLQNSISALRKVLGPAALVTRSPGYMLVVADEASDLAQFEGLVAQARTLPPDGRADTLREALALWRGDPLSDVGFEPSVEADIRRLDELRVTTVEDRIDADLACGR